MHFLQGFDFTFRNKVHAQLHAENPMHHTDNPCKLEQISSATLFVLSCNKGDTIELSTKEDNVVVKREHFDISNLKQFAEPMASKFNMVMLVQEVAKIMNMNMQQGLLSVPQYTMNNGIPTQLYQGNMSGMSRQAQFQQQQRPRSNNCIFCGEIGHFINSCLTTMDYVQNGKCMHNLEGQIILPNGEQVNPRLHFGTNIKEQIDNWHAMATQTKVSSNLVSLSKEVETTGKEMTKLEPTQSQFVWIEVQDESNSEPVTPETNLKDLRLMESLLNSTQKKVDEARCKARLGKGNGPITRSVAQQEVVKEVKKDRTHSTAKTLTKPNMATSNLAKKPRPECIPIPQKDITMPNDNAHMPQYEYVTPIEDIALLEKVTQSAIDTSLQLTMQELLAVLPDIRKAIKEQVTTKCMATNGREAVQMNIIEEEGTPVITTLMATLPEHSDGLVVSNHSEKLQAMDVILNSNISVEAILDEGSQIIGLNKSIWEKMGLAIRADHLVWMESANSSQNMSMGLLQDLKLTICGYEFYLQVQVIEDVAYNMLLGLPFHILTHLAS